MLQMTYIPSEYNPADGFSRQLSRSDAMLSCRCWNIVDAAFGGLEGHNVDLMALDSNAQCDRNGIPLHHFAPFVTPHCAGVNVFNQDLTVCEGSSINAYVFPPFTLIGPLLRFIWSQHAVVTVVVPKLFPLPLWWPIINAMSKRKILVAEQGSSDALLFPTRQGFQPGKILFDLWAFRVGDISTINVYD
jgi:hypothetical protein